VGRDKQGEPAGLAKDRIGKNHFGTGKMDKDLRHQGRFFAYGETDGRRGMTTVSLDLFAACASREGEPGKIKKRACKQRIHRGFSTKKRVTAKRGKRCTYGCMKKEGCLPMHENQLVLGEKFKKRGKSKLRGTGYKRNEAESLQTEVDRGKVISMRKNPE